MPKPGNAITIELTASSAVQRLGRYIHKMFPEEPIDLNDNKSIVAAAQTLLGKLVFPFSHEERVAWMSKGACEKCGEPIAYAEQYGCPVGYEDCPQKQPKEPTP